MAGLPHAQANANNGSAATATELQSIAELMLL
jgi:hypothetical protein